MQSRGRKIILGFVFRNVYTILNMVLAFFMMPFILHHLGDRMYGLWVLMGSFTGYMGYIDLGLTQTVARFISKAVGRNDSEEINRVVNTSFLIYLVLSVIVMIVTFGLMAGAGRFTTSQADLYIVRILLLCIGLNLAISFPVRAFGGLISARLEYKISESIQISELLLRYGLIYVFFKMGFGIIAMGVIVCGVAILLHVAFIISAFSIDKNVRIAPSFYFSRKKVKELFSVSVFAFISKLAGLLIGWTDAFVVSYFLGLAVNAHYAIAAVIMGYLSNFLFRTSGLIDPIFSQDDARGDHQAIRDKLLLTTKIMIFIVTFFCSMAIIYGRYFIQRWVGVAYLDAYPVLVISAFSVVVSKSFLPANAMLFNTSRHKFVALASSIEGVANFVLSIILVRHYGMIGVALGTLIPMICVRFVFQPFYMSRFANIKLAEIYLNLFAVNLFKGLTVVLLPYLLLGRYAAPEYLRLLGIGSGHFIIFIFVIWVIGFNRDERQYLTGFIKRGVNK